MLEDLQVTAGARELVVALGDRDYRLAVATSSQPWMVDRILRQTGLGGHFQAVVTAADVERHKPAPDAYLQALDRLGVTAAEATVIEDSESGVSAAVAAEIPTLARRHETNRRHDLTKAEVVLDSLRQTDQILQRSTKSSPGRRVARFQARAWSCGSALQSRQVTPGGLITGQTISRPCHSASTCCIIDVFTHTRLTCSRCRQSVSTSWTGHLSERLFRYDRSLAFAALIRSSLDRAIKTLGQSTAAQKYH